MCLTLALCLQFMIHAESTSETLIFTALFWENYPIWQSFWPQGHLTDHNEPRQMEGGNELHHQIVQCLKYVGFWIVQVLSCALPRSRGRCFSSRPMHWGLSVPGWIPQASSFSTAELSARWGVTAVESEKLCKRRNKFSSSAKEQGLERELGKSESPKQSQESWNEVHVAQTKGLSNGKT